MGCIKVVIAGLDPAIHPSLQKASREEDGCAVKPAHDWLQKSLRSGAAAGISVAGLIHRREFAAAEIHHARGEPAAARDPVTHVLRVDVHQQLRRLAARHLLAIAAGMPGRVEAEPRAA